MTVTDAVTSRRSVRAFLKTPVAKPLMEEILTKASRAASGGNVQPWQLYVVSGESLAAFRVRMIERSRESHEGDLPLDYAVYPQPLKAPYRDYRFKNGEDYYGLAGIPREDKAARARFFANNYDFFGAPLALFCFVDREMGAPQWSDLGIVSGDANAAVTRGRAPIRARRNAGRVFTARCRSFLNAHGGNGCCSAAWRLDIRIRTL